MFKKVRRDPLALYHHQIQLYLLNRGVSLIPFSDLQTTEPAYH